MLWAVAVLLSGAATSYWWLLAARVGLGIVTATAGPAVASLTGDFFPASERGRIYGMIVGGELVGTGIGYVISGDISSVVSWRFAFWWLIVPSLALAWVVRRLPEPARGGRSQLRAGAQDIRGEREVAWSYPHPGTSPAPIRRRTTRPCVRSGAPASNRRLSLSCTAIPPGDRSGGRSVTCCGCAPTW